MAGIMSEPAEECWSDDDDAAALGSSGDMFPAVPRSQYSGRDSEDALSFSGGSESEEGSDVQNIANTATDTNDDDDEDGVGNNEEDGDSVAINPELQPLRESLAICLEATEETRDPMQLLELIGSMPEAAKVDG